MSRIEGLFGHEDQSEQKADELHGSPFHMVARSYVADRMEGNRASQNRQNGLGANRFCLMAREAFRAELYAQEKEHSSSRL